MCVSFSKYLPNPHVSCYLRNDGSVGSASAYQSVESGIESRLRLIF